MSDNEELTDQQRAKAAENVQECATLLISAFALLRGQKKRTKRKLVDVKASKGRRIRYVTIPQLVNFFPAMPERISWSYEKRNDLFKSLFMY